MTTGTINGQHAPASFLAEALAKEAAGRTDPATSVPGVAPNWGQYAIPHVLSFQSIFGSLAKVYRPTDEAIKSSLDNARFMRNDCGIMECVESRQRSVALLDWHLEPEDESSHEQKELCTALTKILNRIKRFTDYRYNLLHALWYGRYGIQHQYRWAQIGGAMRVLPYPDDAESDGAGWLPINGDKLVFRYDDGRYANNKDGAFPGQVGIRVGGQWKPTDKINDRWEVEYTDRGMAYFLAPWERKLVAIHKHMIEDGAFEAGLDAGMIHGVGIRSRIYWDWFQKQEALAFLMEYLERSAGGIELWYYDEGNPDSKRKTEEAATQRIGNKRNVILVPRPRGDDAMAYGVQVVEPGMAGIESLKDILTNYFGHRIKRYILGQVLTSEAEATGLGSGVADAHLDTLMMIIRYDARGLDETITDQMVRHIKDWNFPHARNIHIRYKTETEAPDLEKKLDSWQRAYEMGCRLKERDVMDLIGAEMPGKDDRALQHPQFTQQPGMGGPGGMPGDSNGGPGGGGPGNGPTGPGGGLHPTTVAVAAKASEETARALFGDVSNPDADTGERVKESEHYDRSWNETDHPRGQPDNAGQFANKSGAGDPSRGAKASDPLPFLKERIKNEKVDRYDEDAIESVMTPDEAAAFVKWKDEEAVKQKERWVDSEMDDYDPDEEIDWDEEFGGDEFLGEDGYIDETLPEIQQRRKELIDEKRIEREDYYDRTNYEGVDASEYLGDFYQDHRHEPRIAGGFASLDTWGMDGDEDYVYGFETSAGRRYEANVVLDSSNAKRLTGKAIPEFMFSDAEGSFGITGAGNAREVFTRIIKAALSIVEHAELPELYFSAEEPSRQRLYDRMVKSLTHDLPNYAAIAAALPGGGRAYVVALKERFGSFTAMAGKLGVKPETLVSAYAKRWGTRSTHMQWEPIEPEKNPAWFDDDGEWSDFAIPEEERPERYSKSIDEAAAETDTNPSDEQRVSGNYRKGKFRLHGLSIAIETPRGAERRGTNRAGESWSVTMPVHYGYIHRTEGRDGDHVDCSIGPHPESEIVYVVDQNTPGGRFDEHKCLIGFTTERAAAEAYLASYADDASERIRDVTALTIGQFKAWLESGDMRRPLSDQVSRYARQGDTDRYEAANERWITIGGAVEGEKRHAGGTPVKINTDTGKIVAGPEGIAKKGVRNLSDFGKPEAERTGNQFSNHPPSVPAKESPDAAPQPATTEERQPGVDGQRDAGVPGVGGRDGGFSSPRVVSLRQSSEQEQAEAVKRVPERFQQHLTDAQKVGVGTSIKTMDEKGGFLLADGTGVGKTRQILGVAGHYAAAGSPVVIVAPAEVLKPDWKNKKIAGSYANDGAAMGLEPVLTQGDDAIEPGKVYLTTYQNLAEVSSRMPHGSVFIADEAHALKNYGTKQSEAGQAAMDKSKAVLLATATPADKPTDLDYLYRTGVFGGMKKHDLFPLLGMRQTDVWTGKQTVKKWEIDPSVGASGVYERLGALFQHLGESGRMLKRELSWEGVPIESRDITLPAGAQEELAKVGDLAKEGKKNKGLARAASLMAQRGHAEKWKIPHAVEEAQKAIKEGRQVVLFTARVNSTDRGDDGPSTDATVGALVDALKASGIGDVGVIAGGTPARAKKAMDAFQGGKHKVVVATIESGGTGINLDDTTGQSPRTTVFLTPPMSGTKYVQAAGRTWRQTTKSLTKVVNLFADTEVDQWNKSLIENKMKVLQALGGTKDHGVSYDTSEEEAQKSFIDGGGKRNTYQEAWRKRQDAALSTLKDRLGGRSTTTQQSAPAAPAAPAAPNTSEKSATSATFTKLKSGDWGLRIEGDVKAGDTVTTTRKDGTKQQKTVARVVWAGNGVTLAEMYERDRHEVSRYEMTPAELTRARGEAGESLPAKRSSRGGKGGKWLRIGGGAPAFVGPDGTIKKGCPGLKGENVDDLIDEDEESRDRRAARQAHADAKGVEGKDVTASAAKKWEGQGARRQHEAAKKAARMNEVPVADVLATMPEAFQLRMEEWERTENARAAARRKIGLNASNLGKIENAYRDYSTVKNWDTMAESMAMEFPEMGFGRSGDLAAEVWEFIREGSAPRPQMHDDETAEQAAKMVGNGGRGGGSGRGAAGADDSWEPDPDSGWGSDDESFRSESARERESEAVPFSRRMQAAVDRYAGKKPAKGQGEFRWITLNGGEGTHVKIDGEGNIGAGPEALTGKNLDDLKGGEGKGDAKTESNEQRPNAHQSQPENPFRQRADELQRKIDRLQGGSVTDRAMEQSFPLGTGRPGNASSKRTSKMWGKRIDKTIDDAKKATELVGQRNSLLVRADEFDAGKIDASGKPTARTVSESEQKAKSLANAQATMADYYRETLKPGDMVHVAANPDNAVEVKRINKNGITAQSGSTWKWDEIIPRHPEGRAMSLREAIESLKAWRKGKGEASSEPTAKPEAESPKPAAKPLVKQSPGGQLKFSPPKDRDQATQLMSEMNAIHGDTEDEHLAMNQLLPDNHPDKVKAALKLRHATKQLERAINASMPFTQQSEPSSKPTVPGAQSSLFGGDDLKTGQKSLFNVVRPGKTAKKPPADLLASVADEVKAILSSKATISPADIAGTAKQADSLEGQKDLFSRVQSSLDRYLKVNKI